MHRQSSLPHPSGDPAGSTALARRVRHKHQLGLLLIVVGSVWLGLHLSGLAADGVLPTGIGVLLGWLDRSSPGLRAVGVALAACGMLAANATRSRW